MTSPKTKVKIPPSLPTGCDALLSPAQVLFALGDVCRRKLSGMIARGEFPGPDCKVGKSPRWRVSAFNAWVDGLCPKKGG